MYPHFVFLGHTFFVFTFEKKTAERTPKHEKRGVWWSETLFVVYVDGKPWNDKFRVKFIKLPKLGH